MGKADYGGGGSRTGEAAHGKKIGNRCLAEEEKTRGSR